VYLRERKYRPILFVEKEGDNAKEKGKKIK
jgi:hypothetical protein